jgi:hypothetical protein
VETQTRERVTQGDTSIDAIQVVTMLHRVNERAARQNFEPIGRGHKLRPGDVVVRIEVNVYILGASPSEVLGQAAGTSSLKLRKEHFRDEFWEAMCLNGYDVTNPDNNRVRWFIRKDWRERR